MRIVDVRVSPHITPHRCTPRYLMSARHEMSGLTDYFFAMPSFWSGFGRVLEIGGRTEEYNWTEDPAETDANAIFSDFRAVGVDIATACSQYEAELGRRPEDAAPPR